MSRQTKAATALVVAAAVALAGYLGARGLAATQEAATATTTQRVVTFTRTTRASAPSPDVVTHMRTITQPGQTEAVTVRRNGRTVVLRPPAETVTTSGPGKERVVTSKQVVTSQRTDTVVRTETADRPTTVTTPGQTHTVTQEVTQPARTVTQTTTDTVTVTQPVTVTEAVTVTQTETHRK